MRYEVAVNVVSDLELGTWNLKLFLKKEPP